MALKIYGRRSSANVQKVVWICCEGGLKFETENLGGKYGGNESDEFKSMNPNGRIPVLKDNDFIFHAGTVQENSKIYAVGGRVLNFISVSEEFDFAKKNILNNLDELNWSNGFYRKDIGYKVIKK